MTPFDGQRGANVWYKDCPLGKNSLSGVVKKLMIRTEGRYSNQSMRRTGATRLFQSGFEEDIVCKTTGHRSHAVRVYKETSNDQQRQVSRSLYYGTNETTKDVKTISEETPSFSGNFSNCTFNITINKQ